MKEDFSFAGRMKAKHAANVKTPSDPVKAMVEKAIQEIKDARLQAVERRTPKSLKGKSLDVLRKELADAEKLLAEHQSAREEAESELALEKAHLEEVEEIARNAARQWSRNDPAYGSQNKFVTKDEYEAAKARLKESLGSERISRSGTQLKSGKPLTEAQAADLNKISLYHREAGLSGYRAWSKAMRADLRPNKPAFGSRNKYFTNAEANAAKARLKESLSSGGGNFLKILALAFCLMIGVMIWIQGIGALWAVPAGAIIGLFAAIQVVLPIMLGVPRAVGLVAKGQMRPSIFGAIIRTPVIWFASLFALWFFWPSAAKYLAHNTAFNLGTWLGGIAVILVPLSKKGRDRLRQDFDKTYCRFHTAAH